MRGGSGSFLHSIPLETDPRGDPLLWPLFWHQEARPSSTLAPLEIDAKEGRPLLHLRFP